MPPVNSRRRLDGHTVEMTLEIESVNDKTGQPFTAKHPLLASLMYDERGVLWEVNFVGRGKIGHGMNLMLHNLGIKLSRAIQGRNPDTGEPFEQ